MKKQKIICVVGPTASGKTALGVTMARYLDGEVISADSMQIYRDMHIASAAPDSSETEGVPHHLVEFLPYGSTFTVADYVKIAREKMKEIGFDNEEKDIDYRTCSIDINITKQSPDIAMRNK